MGDWHTLPELANVWGAPLDVLRVFLRRNPELSEGAHMAGPTRVYPPAVAERIRAAFEASRVKRQPAVA